MSDVATLTDGDSRHVIATELDTNLLVEAGAGSGKTHEMASRMAASVAAGKFDVGHMAAVTFTRKAAAELRGRFQLALEDGLESLRSAPPPSAFLASSRLDAIARLEDALQNLERLFAGTIHSFCAHILREHPVEANIAPGFTELDELGDAQLRKQAWRDFLAAERAAGNPLLAELWEAGLKPEELDKAFETVCGNDDVDFPPGDGQRPDLKETWKALDKFWIALQKMLIRPIAPDTSCKTQKAMRRYARQIRIANTRRQRPAVLAQMLRIWEFTPHITQNRWADDTPTKKRLYAEVTALHHAFIDGTVAPFMSAWREYLYRLIVTLLVQARRTAADARLRQNTLNYNDLLLRTVKLLRENATVRHALQQKYRWLFVDEFQDTDPVQAEIIVLLAAEEPVAASVAQRFSPADWTTARLRPGALFVVGDPKQSIYRFRRADIDIYNLVRSHFATSPGCAVVPLTTNFRSVPQLCDWANAVFSQKFPADPTAQSPKFAPLESSPAARERARESKSPFGVWKLTAPADGGDEAEWEAERIARYIRSEVDAGRAVFGDFLILTRKKKERLWPYVHALDALQIASEVTGAGAFADSQHVRELSLLLRALSDPQDSIALVGVLRGSLFGINDQDLFAWKQSGGWFSLFAPEPSGSTPGKYQSEPSGRTTGQNRPAEPQPVSAALTALRRMYDLIRRLPAGAALDRILELSGYLPFAATSPGGVDAGDLLHAVDRVRQVVEQGRSLADAADALDADAEASSEVDSIPLEPGRSDVVRLMNLHKAKGLEARVVFLADPCGGPKRRADCRIVREGTTARGWFSIVREWNYQTTVIAQPAGWAAHEAAELEYRDAEEIRLLYVAATRARDMLVVGRYANPGERRPWGALDPFLGSAKELKVPTGVGAPKPRMVDLSAAAHDKALAAQAAAHAITRTPSWSVTSVTEKAKYVAKIVRDAEGAADDDTRPLTQDTPAHRADAGMAWGTLIHGLLEHAMRHLGASTDDLRRLGLWLIVEQPELRSVLDRAITLVQEVSRAPFWLEAAKAPERHVEAPFATAEARAILFGVIDLVFGGEAEWQIVDYKTDVYGDPSGQSKYIAQLRAYEVAWRAITGRKATGSLHSVSYRQ